MIAVIISEDGLNYKVVTQTPDGELVNITDQYKIHPMAIRADGKDVVGFHVGFVKAEGEELEEQVLGSGGTKPPRSKRMGNG